MDEQKLRERVGILAKRISDKSDGIVTERQAEVFLMIERLDLDKEKVSNLLGVTEQTIDYHHKGALKKYEASQRLIESFKSIRKEQD